MSAEWEVVGAAAQMKAVMDFLDNKGLGKYAEKIIEVTDVASLDDFKMIDAQMAEEIIQTLQLKLVSAQKLRQAVAEAHGARGAYGASEADSWCAISEAPPAPSAPAASTEAATCAAEAPEAPEAPEAESLESLQEVIAICIDRSGSMGTPFAEVTLNVVKGETKDSVAQRTRMEAVKAMFYAFRDRVESIGNDKYHLGLLQFDDKVECLLDTTPCLDRFEAVVDDMKKRGQTAIYSSIVEATKMLQKYFTPDSKVDLRVLVLTDDQNNSGVSPEAACEAANAIGAVVDAILVGHSPDADLRRIVTATEGQCFSISHLGEGFELLESEAVVSLKARRGGAEKPPFVPRQVDFRAIAQREIIQGSNVPRVNDSTKERYAGAKVLSWASVESCNKATPLGPGAVKRVLSELKQLGESSARGIHIFPSEDISFWRVLLEGHPDSPFVGGIFAVDIVLPNDYPFKPPKINFHTPIYHCNVNTNGAICLDILKDSWSPSLSVFKCLESIRALMADPNPDDAMRQWIAELTLAHKQSNGADTRYFDQARENTAKDASLDIEGWKAKWGIQ